MLQIQSLSVRYNGHDILNDVNLSIVPGQILSVIGPNGAGKSTLIRSISGVLALRQGKITVDGKDLTRMTAMQRARYLSVVPQARELPGAFDVYQAVLLGRTPFLGWLGRTGQHDHRLVDYALQATGLTHLAHRRLGTLSGGEQQRVLLARALAQDTPILLLDEPTTHLDLEHQSSILSLLRNLATEKHLAVLLVLHDLNLAALYSDRIAVVWQGSIGYEGSPEEVLTSENLSKVYHVPVQVIAHPEYGTPLILPESRPGVAYTH